ncbi:MAG: ABC transporter substrate-binding protein [Alphaproteobacteria bacterium]|nr:ABC transporter substrate-binding protein [Alphaproteobacteria bacterium]
MRKLLLVLLLTMAPMTAKAESKDVVKKMTDEIVSEVVLYNKEDVEDAVREQALLNVVNKYFDVDTIVNYVLRSDVSECTQIELNNFRKVFLMHFAKMWAYRLQLFYGYQFTIKEVDGANGDDLVVTTFDIEESYSNTEFVWRVNSKGKIVDMIVEGVSVVQGYRAEFSEYLKKHEKSVRKLTNKLYKYVKTPREEPFKVL